jgi:hypothetical protein
MASYLSPRAPADSVAGVLSEYAYAAPGVARTGRRRFSEYTARVTDAQKRMQMANGIRNQFRQ